MKSNALYGFIFLWMLTATKTFAQKVAVESTLELIDIFSLERDTVFHTQDHIEAPNWSPDGKTLIYNSNGLLYSFPLESKKPELIPTDFANRINNDHGISPDGKKLVISDNTETGKSNDLFLTDQGGNSKKHNSSRTIILAWMVARWKNLGLLCRTKRQL